ncbi:hypothetical protein DTO013E5_8181 [Penicillium roqueforti]|nr:hypothetical protein DTO013F2_8634 [Penicillium roqueforti]KAI3202583.1 hypothetical protein DTO013E5_8181 [Penicillium roqueforti]
MTATARDVLWLVVAFLLAVKAINFLFWWAKREVKLALCSLSVTHFTGLYRICKALAYYLRCPPIVAARLSVASSRIPWRPVVVIIGLSGLSASNR